MTRQREYDDIEPAAGARRHATAILALALIVLLGEGRAYAYTDPGSGLLILQLLTSAVIGAFFYFRRLRDWIRRSRDESKPE